MKPNDASKIKAWIYFRFHLTVENLGAKLPIISVPNSSTQNEEATSLQDDNPPPGFIKLENPASHGDSSNAASSATNTQELTSQMPPTMQRYAAQLYAASALLKDLKNDPTKLPMNNAELSEPRKSPLQIAPYHPPNPAFTTYMALQNPSALSALLSKTTQSQEFLQKLISGQATVNPLLNQQSAFNPVIKSEQDHAGAASSAEKKSDGYIHIRAGYDALFFLSFHVPITLCALECNV